MPHKAKTTLDVVFAHFTDNQSRKIPSISHANAVMLCELLRKTRPKNVLEIGTANGFSAACFAVTGTAWGGTVSTIEISVPTREEASQHFAALGLDNINAYCGDAVKVLTQWQQMGFNLSPSHRRYDWVFIDGQKLNTLLFYKAVLPHLNPQATIVIDDVLKWKHKMQPFYEYLAAHNIHYELFNTDSDDAIMVIEYNPA